MVCAQSCNSGRRTSLGVVPDYTEEPTRSGVKISGTTPGTPAAKAGLKAGDILIKFGPRNLDRLEDLSAALAESKPGDKVELKIVRDGKEIAVETTLAERKGE